MSTQLSRPCIAWGGAMFSNGYGHVAIANRHMTAHRVAFISAVGDPGPELVIDHLCRNRACVEVTHLEAVDQRTNLRRAWPTCRRGIHPLAGDNVAIRGGRRSCRACEADRRHEFAAAHPHYQRDYARARKVAAGG